MGFLNWVLRKIPFMDNERRRLKSTVKAVESIGEMFLPAAMVDFDDVLSSLYDLITDLPEGYEENISEFKNYSNQLHTTSSSNLLAVLRSGLNGNFSAVGNDGVLIRDQAFSIRFLEWYSNMSVFEETTEELKDILPKAISYHRSLNKSLPLDVVNKGVEISNKEIAFVTHRYFKYIILDYLEALGVLTDIRMGGRVD